MSLKAHAPIKAEWYTDGGSSMVGIELTGDLLAPDGCSLRLYPVTLVTVRGDGWIRAVTQPKWWGLESEDSKLKKRYAWTRRVIW